MNPLNFKVITLITNESPSKEIDAVVEYIHSKYNRDVNIKNYLDVTKPTKESLYLLYLKDYEIKQFFKSLLHSKAMLALLPHAGSPIANKSYGIAKNIYNAIEDAFDIERYTTIDLLRCNEELVFNTIVIGNVHGLNDSIEKQNIFERSKNFFENLKELKLQDFKLTTHKEYTINTAASGIMVLEHNLIAHREEVLSEKFYINDGKLNAFILAPTSILSYIYYLILTFVYAHFKLTSLPKSVGVVKTSKLTITSKHTINFKQDNVRLDSKSIELEILKQPITLALGRKINNLERFSQSSGDEKEIVKTKYLPHGEVSKMLVSKNIPLFKKAQETDFKELFVSLRESAKLSSVFLVLMVLSTLLATTGLFQNSSPVIIGAMILAPLMAPIVSLSMGAVRDESELISNSVKTLLYGIGTALLFSMMLTYLIPLTTLTDEMRSRLNPNLLDLMVAVISGIAGAYASAKSEISKSLAGVAIAVALVPPLSVTGIGLGWSDWDMVYGSSLLFITNLVGITLSASLTFLILGYSAVHRAKKGIMFASIVMVVVAIPLLLSFNKVQHQNTLYNALQNHTFSIHDKKINIKISQIDLHGNQPLVYLTTYSDNLLQKNDIITLKQAIKTHIQEEVRLQIISNSFIE